MAEAISRMSSLQKKYTSKSERMILKGNTMNNKLNESFKSIGDAENQPVPGNPSDAQAVVEDDEDDFQDA